MIDHRLTVIRFTLLMAVGVACLGAGWLWTGAGFISFALFMPVFDACVVHASCQPFCTTCPPDSFSITIEGVVDGTCSDCDTLNGTFVLTNTTDPRECIAQIAEDEVGCICPGNLGLFALRDIEVYIESDGVIGGGTQLRVEYGIAGPIAPSPCASATFEGAFTVTRPGDCAATSPVIPALSADTGTTCDLSAATCTYST